MEKSGGRVGKPAPINTFVMVIDRTLNTSVLLCFRSVLVLSIRVPFRRNIDVPFSSSVKDVFCMTKSRWFLDTIYTPWETESMDRSPSRQPVDERKRGVH